MFLERACRPRAKESFFARITTPASVEDALDDVVDGQAQATLVDGVSLDCYKRRKPGRFARLKEIRKAGPFPAAVVAYHAGAVDDAILRRVQSGLMDANKSAFGRQLLTLWKITGFEPVPSGFEQNLQEVAKAYPPPREAKAANKR